MFTSTTDNADAADPGVDDGTAEISERQFNGLACPMPLTLSETNVSVDPRQRKARFRRHFGRSGGRLSGGTRHGEEGDEEEQEARRPGGVYMTLLPAIGALTSRDLGGSCVCNVSNDLVLGYCTRRTHPVRLSNKKR